jgi:hypothetical protein
LQQDEDLLVGLVQQLDRQQRTKGEVEGVDALGKLDSSKDLHSGKIKGYHKIKYMICT